MEVDLYFTPLEPPIYELLAWDMDAIMPCLEVIRRELPQMAADLIPKNSQVAIFAMTRTKFPGGSYPVLGVVQFTEEYDAPYLAIEARIRTWCLQTGKDGMMKLAAEVQAPTWPELKEMACYPLPTAG
ncbi:hypothetical protein OKA04_05070 [Luteolibacter flavescens]|uniref:Uncharacterized protein n=1 Tax=Luteolibacter flavescens TaxID=1859460 RepID=A0ABT3FKL5_9BACT|nr:hypothetical protein [Luteolibacter flavescens]MCW1884090.1 hypothetical protein [Luteolibacter flavescens]